MPAASSPTGTKSFQNMTLEQQALLAEAISVHNPGLIDPNRKRTESVGSDSTPRAHQQSPSATTTYSTGTTNNSNSTTVLASSLFHRSPQARRASTSRPNGSPESSPYGQSSNIRAATAAYSAIPPLTTAALQQSVSSTPSPTAESPSGLRTLRMSNGSGPGIAPAGTARMSKQLLSQRPPSQQGGTNGTGILGSPVQNQSQSHIQSQLPASLEGIEIGDRVVVESMSLSGYLRKNDGSVNGVSYFTCRPKCGIFVLAAKIVKTELLLPFLPSSATSTQQPPAQEDTQATPPPINHAAQAAARITAGSRASKYIGVTASQLKQRNGMPQPSNSRLPSQQQQQPNELTSAPTNSTRAPISSAPINPPTTSPTPTARTGLANRLSHPGSK
ncbi:hypothetical protein BGZ80_005191, partial [Entomortierella chlamydospora]